jgi:hypothetical protein
VQRFVDVVKSGLPQDSTPGVWDVVFYNETAREEPPPGVLRLPSDQALSRYPAAQESWQAFASSADGQTVWNDVSVELNFLPLVRRPAVDNANDEL